MAESDDKVTCPVCGHPVHTKEEGTKIKAHRVSGEKCEGSDMDVPSDDVTPTGIDKGTSYEALESPQGDEQATDKSTDPADENDAQTAAQKLAASGDGGEFVHTIKVAKPAPHLEAEDPEWHDANAKLAALVAQREGYVLVREPQYAGHEETETHYLVRYSAPVK